MQLSPELLTERLNEAVAQAGGLYTAESVSADVAAGRMHLLQADDGSIVIMQIGSYRGGAVKVLWILLAAGSLKGVMSLMPRGEEFARANGCARLVMDGRSGWDRVLGKFGWRKHCVRWAYDVENP